MSAIRLTLRPVGERALMGQSERDRVRERVIAFLDRYRTHPGIDNAALTADILMIVLDTAVDT